MLQVDLIVIFLKTMLEIDCYDFQKFSILQPVFLICVCLRINSNYSCSQSCWIPHYEILDASENEIFKIKGPCCICSGVCCTCDFPFEIFAGDTDGTPVGRIAKQYSGAVKEMFTDATNFSVNCECRQVTPLRL